MTMMTMMMVRDRLEFSVSQTPTVPTTIDASIPRRDAKGEDDNALGGRSASSRSTSMMGGGGGGGGGGARGRLGRLNVGSREGDGSARVTVVGLITVVFVFVFVVPGRRERDANGRGGASPQTVLVALCIRSFRSIPLIRDDSGSQTCDRDRDKERPRVSSVPCRRRLRPRTVPFEFLSSRTRVARLYSRIQD